jgi:pimeloyl-ACP methyl ester carboxylesterase
MKLLHSEIFGDKTPMMIIHGYFGMGENWKTMAKRFSEHYQVHLVDLRNHGNSFHTDSFSYELMVEDLVHYIHHHQLEKVTIIGHSMGGKSTMLLAATYPELIDRLVIVDIAPKFYPPHHQDIIDALIDVDFDKVTSRKDVEKVLSQHLNNPVVVSFFLKSLYRNEDGNYSFRFNLDSLTKNNFEVGKVMLQENIRFEKPTLFVRGEDSDYIMQEDYQLIEKHFTAVNIQSIPKSGHWLHVEKPNEFYEIASSFLLSSKH